jgi:hypothetical protein
MCIFSMAHLGSIVIHAYKFLILTTMELSVNVGNFQSYFRKTNHFLPEEFSQYISFLYDKRTCYIHIFND